MYGVRVIYRRRSLKEIERVVKMIAGSEEYEQEALYPLATQRVEIDIDDGVKVNHLKFGSALCIKEDRRSGLEGRRMSRETDGMQGNETPQMNTDRPGLLRSVV